MIFKCLTCAKYKFWNSKCYEVIATNAAGDDLYKVRMCEPCGESIDQVYSDGQALASLEAPEEAEDEDE